MKNFIILCMFPLIGFSQNYSPGSIEVKLEEEKLIIETLPPTGDAVSCRYEYLYRNSSEGWSGFQVLGYEDCGELILEYEYPQPGKTIYVRKKVLWQPVSGTWWAYSNEVEIFPCESDIPEEEEGEEIENNSINYVEIVEGSLYISSPLSGYYLILSSTGLLIDQFSFNAGESTHQLNLFPSVYYVYTYYENSEYEIDLLIKQ